MKNCKNCIGFRTSSLAKNKCAQARRILRIRLRIQAKQRGRVCDTPTPSLIFPTKIGFWSGYMIPLELTLSKIAENLQRASHAQSASVLPHSFSKGEKRGTQCTERLKWQEVSRSENGLGFAKLFSGEGFAKPRLMFFEIRRGFWISPARRRGLGRNPRGLRHFVFWRVGNWKNAS